MTEKQKDGLISLWNWLTDKCTEKRNAIASARLIGQKKELEKALRDALAERTGVEAAVFTLGYCFIKDKNEYAIGLDKMSEPSGRRSGTKCGTQKM